ncbi:MAG: Lrp/AsnC family transcriptional regulator [Planctomycetota bacterium]
MSLLPTSIDDPVNAAILKVAEDQLQGFQPDPLGLIAERSGLDAAVVAERLRAMLEAGVVRRVRQTLLTTSLAPGALVAWKVPPTKLTAAFEFMSKQDPFSGHVVTRTTDGDTPGSHYRLWTTVKTPVGYRLDKHCALLAERTGAEAWRPLPAKKLFALGVGHMRRRDIEPGTRTDEPGRVIDTHVVPLDAPQWRVVCALKREFPAEELQPGEALWQARAEEAGLSLGAFFDAARELESLGLMGRFSAFLEHVKPDAGGARVTRFNALFHWKVPAGREIEAGQEVGRHHCMTHAYWREGGPEFAHVNVMGVAHGLEKPRVLEHKAAIDAHLEEAGIAVEYTNVFWGGRSEIKPSEVVPAAYAEWCRSVGVDPESMRDDAAAPVSARA